MYMRMCLDIRIQLCMVGVFLRITIHLHIHMNYNDHMHRSIHAHAYVHAYPVLQHGRIRSRQAQTVRTRRSTMPGIRQKLHLDAPRDDRTAAGAHLKRLYATATLTASEVADVAASIREDHQGSSTSDLTRLASARAVKSRTSAQGRSRPDTRNCARDVRRAMAASSTQQLPQAVRIACPLWDPESEANITEQVSFLLPHHILDAIPAESVPEYCSFSESQDQAKHDLNVWGNRTGIDPCCPDHPVVACSLWGDGAPYTTTDSLQLLIMTFSSGIHVQHFWIVGFGKRCICRCGCQGRHTFDTIYSIIAWSFRAAAAGRHPSVDHHGKPFAADSRLAKLSGGNLKVRGALVSLRGDWAWFKQSLGLCGWRGEGPSKRVCWKCRASLSDDCPAFDFTTNARWRTQRITMEQFWQQHIERQTVPSPMFSAPGFTIDICKMDWMHVCCLGILQYAVGCTLWELFLSLGGSLGRSTSACAKLLAMVRTMSKGLGVDPPISDLTVGMFRSGGAKKAPKMRLKAAEGRRFLVVLREILRKCFDVSDPHSSTRFSCMENVFQCYSEMDNWIDGGVSSARLERFGRRHLLLYTQLRQEAGDDNTMWRVYPKHHLFAHLVAEATSNPKGSWNYAMESQIGDATAVARRCSKQHMHRSLLERYVASS